MKRVAQPALSRVGQQAFDQYRYVLEYREDLSAVTIRNSLSDLRHFMVWCEHDWCTEQDEYPFTLQVVVLSLFIRYRTYLQTTLWLKPSSINRTLMSLKRYFTWAMREQLIQDDPTKAVKFVPKEATIPRHLSNDEEDALVAAVSTNGTLRDRTIITFLLYTGLRARELCILTCKQVQVGKWIGVLQHHR